MNFESLAIKEMDNFNRQYFDLNSVRFKRSAEKIAKAYRHENTSIPRLVYTMAYWTDGENPESIPDDYFDDPAVMTRLQTDRMRTHIETFDDDFIPFLFPWFGTGVVPSALGSNIVFHSKQDPAVGGPIINEITAIAHLKKPDPYKDGLMPRVLKTIDFMKENTNLPVSVTDPQGPLNIALSICGVENLFIWMYTNPEETHQLMDFCTDVLIDWINIQKKHAGQETDSGAWPHGITLPKGFGGVWIADDDCTQLSPELYREFVVPYNSRVFKAFGGGTIHFCGSARHQIDNFLATDGLTGVNNFCMGDFEQVFEMQEKFENKLALMVCDFSPLDVDKYFSGLFSKLKTKGTIIGSYFSPGYALHDGRYEIANPNMEEVSQRIYHQMEYGINNSSYK